MVARYGRYSDILVTSQSEPGKAGASTEYDLPAELVMSVGRPVLAVPYAGDFTGPPKHVAVAWNGSREATRAVGDAAPFLEGADKVSVISINEKDLGDAGYNSPSADLAAFLERHGVKAATEPITADDIDISDMLLSRIADFGVDMIVMGAYGHSRVRELVMGGATHGILRHMTVPVLMSH